MKIAVLMWYDSKIKYYADNFYKINSIYCQKNNYTLIKSSTRRYNKRNQYQRRNAHWERFPLILKYIENYDYVVWIDADAFFYVDSAPLENIINKYNKEIFLSADCDQRSPPAINSGVIILKNTQQVKNIVEKWAFCEELKYKYLVEQGYLDNWIEDQAMIRGCYRDNVDDIKRLSVVIPYLELQHYHKNEIDISADTAEIDFREGTPQGVMPYIFHLAGRPQDREAESKIYLKKINLDRHLRQMDRGQ